MCATKPANPAPLVKPLSAVHAAAAADLHGRGIDTGFLSRLGHGFLQQLYIAIPSCPAGFGFVWQEQDGQVLGFIACAESTGRLYKQALLRRGFAMALPLARFVLRPKVIGGMIQTLRYPAQTGDGLPAAEVLSIAVSGQARGKGVGKALMQAAMAEFSRRRVSQVRVAVGANNLPANKFYEACGFRLALHCQHHGLPMNIYRIELTDAT